MDRVDLVAVDEEQLDQRHQPLLAQGRVERVLVADREDAAAAAVLDRREDDVGHLLARPVEDAELEQLASRRVCGRSVHRELVGELVVLASRAPSHSSSTFGGTSVWTRCWCWVEPLPIAFVVAVRPESAISAASARGPPTSVCGVR